MSAGVKRSTPERAYRSARRTAAAADTRRAILEAARTAFLARGYAATTVTDIARAAGVNVDTLYASVGRKAEILRAVVEAAISGAGQAVPADERPYVEAIRRAGSAGTKLRLYADAMAEMGPRTAPVFALLRQAGGHDDTCRALYAEISARRAANMRRFAADLRATGELRDDLDDERVADIVWSLNSPEYFSLLVDERGWPLAEFADHLHDLWCRTLLADGARAAG